MKRYFLPIVLLLTAWVGAQGQTTPINPTLCFQMDTITGQVGFFQCPNMGGGTVGPTGPKGDTGPAGPPGQNGVGIQGPQGVQGIPGPAINPTTAVQAASVSVTGALTGQPDGVHAGIIEMGVNTADYPVDANTTGWGAPHGKAITAYRLLQPLLPPNGHAMLCPIPTAGVSQCTWSPN